MVQRSQEKNGRMVAHLGSRAVAIGVLIATTLLLAGCVGTIDVCDHSDIQFPSGPGHNSLHP